jgi:hypothetical protein
MEKNITYRVISDEHCLAGIKQNCIINDFLQTENVIRIIYWNTLEKWITHKVTELNQKYFQFLSYIEKFKNNSNYYFLIRSDDNPFWGTYPASCILKDFIMKFELDHKKIFMTVYDRLQAKELLDWADHHQLSGIRIGCYDDILYNHGPLHDLTHIEPEYKFSIFSRRHDRFRLRFYLKLLENDLLDSFIYTYNNANPYDSNFEIPINKIKKEIEHEFIHLGDKLDLFLEKMPYKVEHGTIYNPHPKMLFESLARSFFHIAVETLPEGVGYFTRDGTKKYFAQVTEKTFKAIAVRRPFMILGGQHSLAWIKERGYKSFEPFIQEGYDLLETHNQRQEFLLSEIKRLNSLNKKDFEDVWFRCKDICEHNFELYKKNGEETILGGGLDELNIFSKIPISRQPSFHYNNG